jgi:hypothetical protein
MRVYYRKRNSNVGVSTGLGGLAILFWVRLARFFTVGTCVLLVAAGALVLAALAAGGREVTKNHSLNASQSFQRAGATLFAVAQRCVRLIERP